MFLFDDSGLMSWRRLIYTLFFYLLLPVLFGRLFWKGRNNSAYRQRWPERLGFVAVASESKLGHGSENTTNQQFICLHVVSVGETMAARPLVEQLLHQFPDYMLWITSTTPTGSDTVLRLFDGRVEHSYLPYDMPGAVQRFLKRVQPKLFLVMETEIWPNLFAACNQQRIPLFLINARLSECSVRRYRKIPVLVNEALSRVAKIMARSERDAEHFRSLGAAAVEVAGDIKFDVSVDESLSASGAALREQWRQRPVWCAGSTHDGEDSLLLEAHECLREKFPDLLLILVPRHPERFESVAELCRKHDISLVKRSSGEPVSHATAVLLGDTMGELMLWYAASDIAFIGGSLVTVGGHNPLEAHQFAIPVISGQHTHNFADLYAALAAAGAMLQVGSQAELQSYLEQWLMDDSARYAAGQAGKQLLDNNRGVTVRLLKAIHTCLNRV